MCERFFQYNKENTILPYSYFLKSDGSDPKFTNTKSQCTSFGNFWRGTGMVCWRNLEWIVQMRRRFIQWRRNSWINWTYAQISTINKNVAFRGIFIRLNTWSGTILILIFRMRRFSARMYGLVIFWNGMVSQVSSFMEKQLKWHHNRRRRQWFLGFSYSMLFLKRIISFVNVSTIPTKPACITRSSQTLSNFTWNTRSQFVGASKLRTRLISQSCCSRHNPELSVL